MNHVFLHAWQSLPDTRYYMFSLLGMNTFVFLNILPILVLESSQVSWNMGSSFPVLRLGCVKQNHSSAQSAGSFYHAQRRPFWIPAWCPRSLGFVSPIFVLAAGNKHSSQGSGAPGGYLPGGPAPRFQLALCSHTSADHTRATVWGDTLQISVALSLRASPTIPHLSWFP